jgi:SAM-dependent methyltransferase
MSISKPPDGVSCTPLNECLCCNSKNLSHVLDLGCQPLANLYRTQADDTLERFPLRLLNCTDCTHLQLSHVVSREKLFSTYVYSSGTSKTLRDYFRWFAWALNINIPSESQILEIASNDGTLLRELQALGQRCEGIDPARNIVLSSGDGVHSVIGYWPKDKHLVGNKFDVIIGINVLAHVEDPFSFLKACAESLSSEGVIIIQPSQARMLDNGEFDTIYHEHLSFFNLESMAVLCARVGLQITSARLSRIHGDSPIYFIQSKSAVTPFDSSEFSKGPFAIKEDLRDFEASLKLRDPDTYIRFGLAARSLLTRLENCCKDHRDQGYLIVFVGAAAKAMTVLNATDIVPDFIVDEAPQKIGMFPPGFNIPVSPLASLRSINRKALFIISAWNFHAELSRKISNTVSIDGSKCLVYFPNFRYINL